MTMMVPLIDVVIVMTDNIAPASISIGILVHFLLLLLWIYYMAGFCQRMDNSINLRGIVFVNFFCYELECIVIGAKYLIDEM